jgi:hypothetical protein
VAGGGADRRSIFVVVLGLVGTWMVPNRCKV